MLYSCRWPLNHWIWIRTLTFSVKCSLYLAYLTGVAELWRQLSDANVVLNGKPVFNDSQKLAIQRHGKIDSETLLQYRNPEDRDRPYSIKSAIYFKAMRAIWIFCREISHSHLYGFTFICCEQCSYMGSVNKRALAYKHRWDTVTGFMVYSVVIPYMSGRTAGTCDIDMTTWGPLN